LLLKIGITAGLTTIHEVAALTHV